MPLINEGVSVCTGLLARDAPSWWKPWYVLCSQEFDDIQKVWVLIPGPHCLDDFCKVSIKKVDVMT